MASIHTLPATPAIDPECPLVGLAGHVCRNRDRHATDPEPLRPGSSCWEGAAYVLAHADHQGAAETAAVDLMDTVANLLAVMARYCGITPDVELEVDDTAAKLTVAQFQASLAGWTRAEMECEHSAFDDTHCLDCGARRREVTP